MYRIFSMFIYFVLVLVMFGNEYEVYRIFICSWL